MNRYVVLEAHADAGLGSDELGTRRFTRPCERVDPDSEASRVAVDSSRVEVGNPSGMDLGSMFAAIDDGQRADLESEIADGWQQWEQMPPGVDRDALRDRLWALEDQADDQETMPPTSRQAKVEGATPNPQKENRSA